MNNNTTSLSPYDMAVNMTSSYTPSSHSSHSTATHTPSAHSHSTSTHTTSAHSAHRTSRSNTSQSVHPYRVEKPKSNHNSPRTVERRKTTTGAKLYATLDDHYNMMMGITGDQDQLESTPEPQTTRPMSWHPSSTQFNPQRQSTMFDQSQHWSQQNPSSSRMSAHGSDYYSLSARNSTCAESSQYYPVHSTGYQAHRGSQNSDSSWQTQQSCITSSFSTPATEPMPWYLHEWARKNQDQAVASQNNSVDFLPIQHPTSTGQEEQEDENMQEDSGKELVGMGLYDLPDSSLDWTSPLGEATGKGLKLEETWQPPEDEDEDEEDEDEDDDASSDDGEDELPPPPAPMPAVNCAKTQGPGNLEGQSFFFDEDDSVTKEWWYQQLKQPSMPVRDAGYGYGWL